MTKTKHAVGNAAGFWPRLIAGFIDLMLIYLVWFVVDAILPGLLPPWWDAFFPGSISGSGYEDISHTLLYAKEFGYSNFSLILMIAHDFTTNFNLLCSSLIAICFGFAYSAGMESSSWQATIGKRILGIKVTSLKGNRLSLPQALARGLSKFISILPAFSGIIAIGLSNDKRAFHDRLCRTAVIKDGNRFWFQINRSSMNKTTKISITNSQGVVLSLAEHMQNVSMQVTQNLKSSDQTPEIRELVQLLLDQIQKISDKIPTENVSKLTKNVTRLSEELSTKTPDKDWCKLSLSGIKEAAEAVGSIGASVVGIVVKLWPLILG